MVNQLSSVPKLNRGTYYPSSGTYIDPTGQGMSIRPEDMPTVARISFEKNTQLNPQLRDIKKLDSQISRQIDVKLPDVPKVSTETTTERINPSTGLPYGTSYITTVPKARERFIERVEKKGVVKSVISTPFEEAAKFYSEFQRKQAAEGKGELYQLGATSRAISELPQTALYLTPAGGGILFAESAEALGTKAGRERLSETSKSLQAQGLSPITSKVLTYGGTGAGLVLGGLGLRGQFKNLKTIRELKLLEKTPTISKGIRLEKGSKGIDILRGVKDVKGTRYITEIRQPYYRVGRDRVILESGEGTALRLGKKGDVQVSIFETFGKAEGLEKTPRLVKEKIREPFLFSKPTIISKELPEAQASLLRLGTREVFSATGKVKKGKIKRGKVKLKTGDLEPVSYKNILGLSKEEGKIIKGTSGEITKGRYDIIEDIKTIKAKPEEISFIKKVTLPVNEETGVLSFRGGGKPSSPEFLKQLYKTEGYESPLLKEGISKVVPKVTEKSKAVQTQIVKDIVPTKQAPIYQPSLFEGTGLYERTESYQPLSIRTDTRQEIGIRTDIKPRTMIDTKVKTDLLTRTETKIKTKPDILTKTFTDTRIKPDIKQRIKTPIKSLLDIGIKTQMKTPTKTKAPTKIKTTTPKTPKPTKLKFTFKEDKEKIKKEKDEFEVFTRLRGEDISIGEVGTIGEARKKLTKELKGTARASGFVTKGGKKLSFAEVGIVDTEFRPSKIEKFRVVQRKTKRIKTSGEIGEIISARKGGKFF